MHQKLGDPRPFARWAMASDVGADRVDAKVWESASGCAPTSQDAWMAASVGPDRLRLAALDGITPTLRTPRVHGLDGAAWAARFTAAVLANPAPVRDALDDANAALVSQFDAARLRDRPHTAVSVAEIGIDAVTITVAGDCQAFIASNGRWREVFGGPLFDEQTRTEWTRWRAEHPDADPVEDVADGYDAILASPHVWRATPIGMFREPHYQQVSVRRQDCDGLVVASDGARLTPDRLTDLEGWLAALREWETREHAHDYKPHDDVTVIAATVPRYT